MSEEKHYAHFENKTPLEHLKSARNKGMIASESVHGAEPSGYLIAAADSCKETIIYLCIAYLLLAPFSFDQTQVLVIYGCFTLALFIWKTCRSALFGWSRLERVHRLIVEEKYEIDHNRAQEKIELLELYQAKGFKDKQLEEVVEVLMADDNRLLQIMLEEELGLTMGSFEHPLKQCLGAAAGTLGGSLISLIGFYLAGFAGLVGFSLFGISLCAFISAKHLNNNVTKHLVWTLSSTLLTLGTLYFLMSYFKDYLPRA